MMRIMDSSLSLSLYSYDDMDEMRPFSENSRLLTAVSRRERTMDDDPRKKNSNDLIFCSVQIESFFFEFSK